MIKFETEQNALKSRVTELERRIEGMTAPEPKPEPALIKSKPKKWSEREKDYLRKAYALGQTDTEIAADLDRTLDSIADMRYKLGLSGVGARRWTKDEDKRLKRLVAKGLTAQEIGKLMNRSADGVAGRKAKIINKKR